MSGTDELYEEPEELTDFDIAADASYAETDEVNSWRKRYGRTSIPSMILDKSLNVVWNNKSYETYFNDLEDSSSSHITTYFNNLKEIDSLKQIYRDLNRDETGFSWQGRVTSKNKKRRSDVANLILTPLDLDEKDCPLSYTGVLDIVTDEYREMLRNMFSSLLEASKLKDNDTGHHIERVNRYSRLIADTLKGNSNFPEVNEDFVEDIGFLAAMHDVGKIGTPDDILNKNGPLETWEREVMNEHTKNGAYILSTYPNPMAKQIALHHHEKWDGTGYPFGMVNRMIPLCARIVALADVYDALRMRRSYKEAFSHEMTAELISGLSGTHFDPHIVKCFEEHHEEFDRIYTSLTD